MNWKASLEVYDNAKGKTQRVIEKSVVCVVKVALLPILKSVPYIGCELLCFYAGTVATDMFGMSFLCRSSSPEPTNCILLMR